MKPCETLICTTVQYSR